MEVIDLRIGKEILHGLPIRESCEIRELLSFSIVRDDVVVLLNVSADVVDLDLNADRRSVELLRAKPRQDVIIIFLSRHVVLGLAVLAHAHSLLSHMNDVW